MDKIENLKWIMLAVYGPAQGEFKMTFFIRASTHLSTELFTYAHWGRLQHSQEQQKEEQ
jgi:hypothetical protein